MSCLLTLTLWIINKSVKLERHRVIKLIKNVHGRNYQYFTLNAKSFHSKQFVVLFFLSKVIVWYSNPNELVFHCVVYNENEIITSCLWAINKLCSQDFFEIQSRGKCSGPVSFSCFFLNLTKTHPITPVHCWTVLKCIRRLKISIFLLTKEESKKHLRSFYDQCSCF